MPQNENCRSKFCKYDQMADEELERILQLDADKNEGEESNTEEILYIMEVLSNRKNATCTPQKTAEEALCSFKKYYDPDNLERCKLDSEKESPRRNRPAWVKCMTAIAAVLAVVVVTMVSAEAFGFHLFGKLAEWTHSVFTMKDEEIPAYSTPLENVDDSYDTLEEILLSRGIPNGIVPSYIPAGYALQDFNVGENPNYRIISAKYDSNGSEIKIQIKSNFTNDAQTIEKSEELVEVYSFNGVDYYIFKDNKQYKAVWINDDYECMIVGNISISEIIKMIDSIGKGDL